MKVNGDKRVEKVIKNFSKEEKARIDRVVGLFSEKGFSLTEVHLKKLTKQIWELKSGNIRLLFGIVEGEAIIVNIFIKKTQQTPIQEIELAESRLKHYL